MGQFACPKRTSKVVVKVEYLAREQCAVKLGRVRFK